MVRRKDEREGMPRRPQAGQPQAAGSGPASSRRPALAGKPDGKHGDSNSVLEGHLVLGEVGVIVSLDRLTVCGKARRGFDDWIRYNAYVEGVTRAAWPYEWQWKTADGGLIQAATKAGGAPEALGASHGRAAVRFDFNPNKANLADVLNVLDWFTRPTVSRVDVALDYFIALAGYRFDRARTKRIEYHGAGGKLETVYLGAASADLRYRIYDKALESAETRGKHPDFDQWRIEAQYRPRKGEEPLPASLFDSLEVAAWMPEPSMDWRSLASLYTAFHEPGLLRGLPSATRRKLKALMGQHFSPLLPRPTTAYAEARPDLLADLAALLVGNATVTGPGAGCWLPAEGPTGAAPVQPQSAADDAPTDQQEGLF
jgi:hypothetical protein